MPTGQPGAAFDQVGEVRLRAAKLVRNSSVKIYPDAPHGLCTTLKDEVNADLLAFIERKEARKAA